MSKQKVKLQNELNQPSHKQEAAARLGALVFAGLAIIGAAEMTLEHMMTLNPTGGHGSTSVTELFARGEGKSESARLPEEFDIGMQTAHVSGF